MPWCDGCSRYWVHTTMNADGTCPQCGRQIAEPADLDPRAPWHFKLLLVAVILYLGFRLWQAVVWLFQRL